MTIPETFENKTFRLLSNGEIELETRDQGDDVERVEAERRFRRSAVDSLNSPTGGGGGGGGAGGMYDAASESVASAGRKRPGQKSVETLVVADSALMSKHQGDERNITIYILTVMNMVGEVLTLK